MAKIEEPTVKVKVEGDTAAFEAKLAQLEQRAERLGVNPLRMEAMHHAVHIECRNDDADVDDVIATAEKLLTFLTGGEHAQPHVHVAVGKGFGKGVDMHAEQAAQAHLDKHTAL